MSGHRVFSVLNAPIGDLDPMEKLIAVYLADLTPDNAGYCFAEHEWFCKKLSLKPRQVIRWLRRMEKEGHVSIFVRHNFCNYYVLRPLPGETLPDDWPIIKATEIRPHKKDGTWKLRTEGAAEAVKTAAPQRAARKTPPPVASADPPENYDPVDSPPEASNPPAIDEDADARARRAWWDYFVQLQGSPPLASADLWREIIVQLLARNIAIPDFQAAWDCALKTWDRPEWVNIAAIYKNFDKLMPAIHAEKAKRQRREAAAAQQSAQSKIPLSTEDIALAQETERKMRERIAKKQEKAAWKREQDIWTDGHQAHCICLQCGINKRKWESENRAKTEACAHT